MSLSTFLSLSGFNLVLRQSCRPGMSQLMIISLKAPSVDEDLASSMSTIRGNSSLSALSSHSSSPSSTQSIIPNSGSATSLLNLIQIVSGDESACCVRSGVSKYSSACLISCGRLVTIWCTSPRSTVTPVLRFSSWALQKKNNSFALSMNLCGSPTPSSGRWTSSFCLCPEHPRATAGDRRHRYWYLARRGSFRCVGSTCTCLRLLCLSH
jgi:hypothetical protein